MMQYTVQMVVLCHIDCTFLGSGPVHLTGTVYQGKTVLKHIQLHVCCEILNYTYMKELDFVFTC